MEISRKWKVITVGAALTGRTHRRRARRHLDAGQ